MIALTRVPNNFLVGLVENMIIRVIGIDFQLHVVVVADSCPAAWVRVNYYWFSPLVCQLTEAVRDDITYYDPTASNCSRSSAWSH